MNNFIMLFVLSLIVGIISPSFLSKRFKTGSENIDNISEMEAINRRLDCFMRTFNTPLNDYSINIEIKDGKVHKITTGTELTEKIFYNNEQTTNQKAFSAKTVKIGIAIYMFLLTFCISTLILYSLQII